MFIACIFADRFPKLWDGVGFWWFFMYCIYHSYTAYVEEFSFQDIRLLTADLQGYYLMVNIILNSTYWKAELITTSFLYGLTCWLMAYFSNSSGVKTCSLLGIESSSSFYDACLSEFTTTNTVYFGIRAFIMVAFLSYTGRYTFESKERRLFLKGNYILH